jgi:hypothetical protein
MSRTKRRTYWCMDCTQWAVPGPYMKCETCAGDEDLSLFDDAWLTRPLCTSCHVQESRATGPECLDCYFSPGGTFDHRPRPVKPAATIHPIPAATAEVTRHGRISA